MSTSSGKDGTEHLATVRHFTDECHNRTEKLKEALQYRDSKGIVEIDRAYTSLT
jgi:hypothetical protein